MPAGRPKKVEAPSRDISPLTDGELAAIAPLKDGMPDMYNFMPTRLVPLDEARQRGFSLFYDGRACRFGHQAPRYVSNVNQCVDCHRLSRGKQPIAGRASGMAVERPAKYEKSVVPNAPSLRPIEPDAFEKRFLVEYAAVKDLERAAHLVNSSAAQIHMRLSTSAVFRAATNDLESRLNIRPTVPDTTAFEWNEDKRARYITVWIDSGDVATARDAIRVTMSEIQAEFARNPAFRSRCEEAEPIANLAFEERAKQLALAGNDKLLTLILKAERPDKFSERLNVDMNVTGKMSDEQLDNRLRYLLRHNGPVIDAEFTDASGKVAALTDARRESAPPVAKSNSDLL
jgi:hypothetical protein